MNIVCPHCSFTRDVPDSRVPDRPVKVTCPKCQQGFVFEREGGAPATSEHDGSSAAPETEAAATTTCPACGLTQPAGDSCAACGVIYAKLTARQAASQEEESDSAPADAATAVRPASLSRIRPEDQPKAGFWIRFVAYSLDSLILGVAQLIISFALGFSGGALLGDNGGGELALALISGLCGMVVSLTYVVFFTGYNGQTPGKMVVRIQVVRSDGTPMTYGRAFLREVVGKFLSGIILGIGYLMAAFDRQKQALHDRIAGTYVIRL